MTGKSPIEWTEQAWNPIVGCSIKSPGCANCYAMKMARRIELMNVTLREQGRPHAAHYDGTTKVVNGHAVFTGKIATAPDVVLLAPLRRKKPTTYFVNSMGDLFHEDCPDEWIDRVFAVMALAPQHTFQVLTKRAERMREYCSTIQKHGRWLQMEDIALRLGYEPRGRHDFGFDYISHKQFLPNVWLGVSTERQKEYDERKEHLRNTPAVVRFFSMEPLLGPIVADYLGDWVIVGGESGPDARPIHPDWARSLRDQCAAAGMLDRFFFKQWGEWWEVDSDGRGADGGHYIVDEEMLAEGFDKKTDCFITLDGQVFRDWRTTPEDVKCRWMTRLGKKAAGRHLDGVEHNGMPVVRR